MGKAFRAVVATALLGLTLAPAASADTSTLDLLLARDACGGSDPPNLRLDLDVGAQTEGCGSLLGIVNDTPDVYPAVAGLPVTVDGTRNAQVAIAVRSFYPLPGGIGDQTITVELIGRNATNNARVTMGRASQTMAAADILRKSSYVAEFDFAVPALTYKSVTLNLTVGGSEFHGFVAHDGNSYVSLPVPDPV